MAPLFSEVTKIIHDNEAEIKKFGVKEIYIFGSVVTGHANDESDIDIFIVPDENQVIGLLKFISLNNFLTKILGRKVDLATRDSLHPELKDRIIQEAKRAA